MTDTMLHLARFENPPALFGSAYDALHEAVTQQIGLTDFGPADYQDGLRVLLMSLDHDARLSETGRASSWNDLCWALAGRAIAYDAMSRHPEHLTEDVRKPVIIVGVPRTGTTALHKLLAVDPQFHGPEKWLLGAPIPRPPRKEWASNPWFRREQADLDDRFGAADGAAGSSRISRAAHNMIAEEVDECIWIQRQSFVSNFWATSFPVASYDAWWQAQDECGSYAHLKRCIRLIGMNDHDKRWLLKNPSHILHLGEMFATFPDAMVIQTHRDPAKAIPSLCRMSQHAHAALEVGDAEKRAHLIGAREVAKWAKGMRDASAVRQSRSSQIFDVQHADFHRNPMQAVRDIYTFIGASLRPEVEAAMVSRIELAPERGHGSHDYDVAEFGLSESGIRKAFGEYSDQFGFNALSAK